MRRDTEVLQMLAGDEPGLRPASARRLGDAVTDGVSAAEEPSRVAVRPAPAASIAPAASVEFGHVLAAAIDHVTIAYPDARIDLAPRVENLGGITVDIAVDGAVRHEPDNPDGWCTQAVAEQLARRSRYGMELRRPAGGAPTTGSGLVLSVHCPAGAVTVDEPVWPSTSSSDRFRPRGTNGFSAGTGSTGGYPAANGYSTGGTGGSYPGGSAPGETTGRSAAYGSPYDSGYEDRPATRSGSYRAYDPLNDPLPRPGEDPYRSGYTDNGYGSSGGASSTGTNGAYYGANGYTGGNGNGSTGTNGSGANGYRDPGYADNGYQTGSYPRPSATGGYDLGRGNNGRSDNGYGDNGYGDNGRADNGYGDNGYTDTGNGYGDSGYGDNGRADNGYGDNGRADNGYGYTDTGNGYGANGYGDNGYANGHGGNANGNGGGNGYDDPFASSTSLTGPSMPAYQPSRSSGVDELFGPLLDLPIEPMDDRFATPIFEAIASVWFRDDQPVETAGEWETPNDAEWRAASERAVSEPRPESLTATGLPRRRPGGQLVPPPLAGRPAPAATPAERVPDRVRDRLSTYQRGLRQGRHRSPDDHSEYGDW
jgi:hypothetical protein